MIGLERLQTNLYPLRKLKSLKIGDKIRLINGSICAVRDEIEATEEAGKIFGLAFYIESGSCRGAWANKPGYYTRYIQSNEFEVIK